MGNATAAAILVEILIKPENVNKLQWAMRVGNGDKWKFALCPE